MRVFLAATTAGINSNTRTEMIHKHKPLYFLETFFNGEKTCAKVLNDVGAENFLLDSGAFSYMSGAKCTKESLLKYLDKYINFINKYNVKYFFELDVDTIFGIEFVEQMRAKLESETHKKCIPVWHKGRGIEYWKKMVDNYKYIAIGGLVFHVKKEEWPLIKKMVDYAYSKGVKVHGLGFTKTKDLLNYKFFSVDSASWSKAGALGQQVHFFNGQYITSRQLNKNNKKVKLNELVAHNFGEWCKFQKYMDKKR
jgi:hypothetical protein